jgi:hypothetical protein
MRDAMRRCRPLGRHPFRPIAGDPDQNNDGVSGRRVLRVIDGLGGTRTAVGTILLCLSAMLSGLHAPVSSANPSPVSVAPTTPVAASESDAPADPVVLAHYYIWFNPTSWNRAKADIPLAGRYSSDDTAVMRRHVQDAKRAGIDGFIVSWKGTEVLNERLAHLVAIAAEEHFKLAITYQGLNFDRDPLPPAQIEADLQAFAKRYADNPVFNIFGRPAVVLTGTPAMDTAVIARIHQELVGRVLLLGSEKGVHGYERIADAVDGNLYYWSSVDPETNTKYGAKLRAFGDAVHQRGGIWIAPVAPGFDARLVGGTSVVDRRDGSTLAEEWTVAETSLPDAIGIISWNEFSENTHIEPSEDHGNRYLDVVASLAGGDATAVGMDSSEPSGSGSPWPAAIALGGFLSLVVVSMVVVFRRRRVSGGRG